MFRHPNYYKELRKRNTDQAISQTRAPAPSRRAPGPGPKQQASSCKPQASSCKIWSPRKSFPAHAPRCWTKIKLLIGCFTWNAIWCGEKRTFLLLVTLNSIVKKVLFLLYANTSGVPKALVFSILVYEILGVFFLKYL